ncbi:hypothetical protein PHIN3_5 [Sinorhizobium phage phiN3]|uniref:Uncharacterized protein n=1 Tax=Sinorhizobium phage phiN3 TaxID=1647405 RepID=A0A0F6YPK2_9CAUD|nr:hypothetical protein AVT40_gp005 [Sinorhizobium phage phiN3]AKF13272.1 hypothetical protein PHIN3_5 [Sinorhizobium phage phiN3]
MTYKCFVIETSFQSRFQRKIYFERPDPTEKGFYRTTTILSGFFHGRGARANVTEKRQFTYHGINEDDLYTYTTDPSITVDGLHGFFAEIGYDYRTKKYASGERIKKWNGVKFV